MTNDAAPTAGTGDEGRETTNRAGCDPGSGLGIPADDSPGSCEWGPHSLPGTLRRVRAHTHGGGPEERTQWATGAVVELIAGGAADKITATSGLLLAAEEAGVPLPYSEAALGDAFRPHRGGQ